MKLRGTAFFIEPQGSLLEVIREKKALLESVLPGQPYVSHPPHCTVFFGRFGPTEEWLPTLATALAGVRTFVLRTTAWQEFDRDSMSNGGHTLAFRAESTEALGLLQRTVANTLQPFRQPAGPHPLDNIEPFATSLRRFGSPFVGEHWIPHFTIGSPRVLRSDPVLALLKSGPVSHSFFLRQLSVWDVDGDSHTKLVTIPLENRG